MAGKKTAQTSPARKRAARKNPDSAAPTTTPGESLRIAREQRGWTQAELAQAADLTQSTVSSIEQGREALGLERAKRLALVLDVHPAELVFPDWETEKRALTRAQKR